MIKLELIFVIVVGLFLIYKLAFPVMLKLFERSQIDKQLDDARRKKDEAEKLLRAERARNDAEKTEAEIEKVRQERLNRIDVNK